MKQLIITPEEREMWASTAAARINAVTPERQCEITAQERLVNALKALEQAEARAERAEKELAGADAEISELRDELEDSRGTEKDAPNVLCAIARLVGVYEHSQELGDDMGQMTLDEVQNLISDKQKAEAEVERLTERVNGLLAEELTDGAVRERIQLRHNMHEVLQENERLTAERDWLADKHIRCAANGEQWYGPTISKELHVQMYPSKTEAIDALKEAARLAVAAGEETCQK